MSLSVITLAASKNYVDLRGVGVERYGARGDGETDDTAAIQAAAAAVPARGVLTFAAGATYVISDTIEVDVDTVRAIEGNGATLIVTDDIPALRIVGSKTSGGASPADTPAAMRLNELSPRITDLHVSVPTGSPAEGVGIQVEGTFGLLIRGCHLFDLRTGIEILGVNRNLTIHANRIYNCADYGVHWNECNVHQQVIANNLISYVKKALFVDNSDVHNVHIDSNSLEGSGSESLIHFSTGSNSVSQVQIVGNGIEDHGTNTGALVLFEVGTAPNPLRIITVTGNEFSGSGSDAVMFKGGTGGVCYNVNITGNAFQDLDGYALRVDQQNSGTGTFGVAAMVFSNNTIVGGSVRNTGVIDIFQQGDVQAFAAIGNVAYNLGRAPIVMRGLTSNSGERLLMFRANIESNNFALRNSAGVDFDWGIDLSTNVTTAIGVIIRNNFLQLASWAGSGMRAAFSGTRSGVIIRENIVRSVPDGEDAFSLPSASASVLVDDNLTL